MKIFITSLMALLLSSICMCGENQISKATIELTKKQCDLPEGVRMKVFILQYRIQLLIENKTNAKFLLNIDKSLITLPAADWESPLSDNHMDRLSQKVMAFGPNPTTATMYPVALIEEGDKDLDDVHWKEWPGKNGDILSFKFVFSNDKSETFECLYEGLISFKDSK